MNFPCYLKFSFPRGQALRLSPPYFKRLLGDNNLISVIGGPPGWGRAFSISLQEVIGSPGRSFWCQNLILCIMEFPCLKSNTQGPAGQQMDELWHKRSINEVSRTFCPAWPPTMIQIEVWSREDYRLELRCEHNTFKPNVLKYTTMRWIVRACLIKKQESTWISRGYSPILKHLILVYLQ
jgi:hypothetical protein